jgi:hypothetical protein
VELDDAIVEDHLAGVFDLVENLAGEIAAAQAQEAAAEHILDRGVLDPTDAAAMSVDKPDLSHVVADAVQLWDQPHSLSNVVSAPPKVDNISSSAQGARALANGRRIAVLQQPVSESGTRDSRAGNKNGLVRHPVAPSVCRAASSWIGARPFAYRQKRLDKNSQRPANAWASLMRYGPPRL